MMAEELQKHELTTGVLRAEEAALNQADLDLREQKLSGGGCAADVLASSVSLWRRFM